MAGKRLLDAAKLFSATRNVAGQHFKIRSEQLDRWSKTSSLAKAVKNQTDRVTLTVQAANALRQRFNEEPPTYDAQARSTSTQDEQSVPAKESVVHEGRDATDREGLQQDHHYRRDLENATSETPKGSDLGVQQEKPERYPTADGTIPPKTAPVGSAAPTLHPPESHGKRAREAPAKDPVEQEHLGELKPASSGDSTIAQPQRVPESIPMQEAVPEQQEVPEGINTDVFHSPRIADLLGGKKRKRGDLGLQGSKRTPIDSTQLQQGKDQDTFNVRESSSTAPGEASTSDPKDHSTQFSSNESREEMHALAEELSKDASANAARSSESPEHLSSMSSDEHNMRESKVPSSRFGRLWQYAGLGTSMAFGAVGESFRRAVGAGSGGSLMLSAGNMERLVAKLSRMRGAALKLGQMMSFQDSKMLPAPIAEVLQRVQDNADYMPASQRNKVLATNLGADWRDLFSQFSEVPVAAASIGQVHKAILAKDGTEVAVKIQYPGVATSISSDLNNLSVLLTASRLLPPGLYLDKTIANARTELAWECDYTREAECQTRFSSLIADDSATFKVPRVITEASGPQVLTAELMHGTAVTKASLHLSQDEKDWLGTQILRLCLRELTEFKFMQTDPNWTNFLYNRETKKIELLDFGAAREFPDKFVDPYVRILQAAAVDDRKTITDLSIQLGYLTGHEGDTMCDAHVNSVLTLSEPFKGNQQKDAVYDFKDQTITDRVRSFIPVMVRERLAPPPEETYSLHRKLSGAFLLLARLGSRVKCREMFLDSMEKWEQSRSR